MVVQVVCARMKRRDGQGRFCEDTDVPNKIPPTP